MVKNKTTQKLFYIYNYEGWFYRVFNTLPAVTLFFEDAFELAIWFEEETALDNYLLEVEL